MKKYATDHEHSSGDIGCVVIFLVVMIFCFAMIIVSEVHALEKQMGYVCHPSIPLIRESFCDERVP